MTCKTCTHWNPATDACTKALTPEMTDGECHEEALTFTERLQIQFNLLNAQDRAERKAKADEAKLVTDEMNFNCACGAY